MRNALGEIDSLVVLGGSSEIGLAVADVLVRRGCRTVVLAVRRPQEAQEAVAPLRAAGAQRVEVVAFDALAPETHAEVVRDITQRVGDLDAVLVAFGVLGDQNQLDEDPLAAAQLVATNYGGAVSASLAVAAVMRRQGHGTLVLLSSVAGIRVRAANFVYGSSKAGLDGFGQGLGDALAGSGASVMLVRPGFVHSKMTKGMTAAPLSTTPAAVAEAVATGLARGSEIVWVPPALRLLFTGLRLLPRAAWRRLPG